MKQIITTLILLTLTVAGCSQHELNSAAHAVNAMAQPYNTFQRGTYLNPERAVINTDRGQIHLKEYTDYSGTRQVDIQDYRW